MIAYFDSSALVPLLIDEPGSPAALQLWLGADQIVSVRLTYVEVRAALGRARRTGRTSDSYDRTLALLETLHRDMMKLDVDDQLVRRAGELADERALRGYDAVHLAAAVQVGGAETLFVSGDRALCAAARQAGLEVIEL